MGDDTARVATAVERGGWWWRQPAAAAAAVVLAALGCYEIPLTAGRSIATDRRFLPAPVPAFVRTTLPTADGAGSRPFVRFVLNQDTGGSIVGPGRVDLFLGLGPEAVAVAGRTKSHGELLVLLPRRR